MIDSASLRLTFTFPRGSFYPLAAKYVVHAQTAIAFMATTRVKARLRTTYLEQFTIISDINAHMGIDGLDWGALRTKLMTEAISSLVGNTDPGIGTYLRLRRSPRQHFS